MAVVVRKVLALGVCLLVGLSLCLCVCLFVLSQNFRQYVLAMYCVCLYNMAINQDLNHHQWLTLSGAYNCNVERHEEWIQTSQVEDIIFHSGPDSSVHA